MARICLYIGFQAFPTLIVLAVVATVGAQYEEEESVSWDVSSFGSCTAACGGGVQLREVTCVRYVVLDGRQVKLEAEDTECPEPAPVQLQPCNEHDCTAEWTPQEWSECSKTCGLGTQTREVHCEANWSSHPQLPGGARHQVAITQCGGSKPITSRSCYLTDCPVSEDLADHAIIVKNYTLWQLGRTKKVKADIGGKLNLFPGQTVVLRCHVRHPALRQVLYWSKDSKLLSFNEHLTIREARPDKDAGTYTCTAQDENANITIKFIQENNPESTYFKKWIRKTKRRRKHLELLTSRRLPGRRSTGNRFHRKRDAHTSSSGNNSSQSRQRDHRRKSLRLGGRKGAKTKAKKKLFFGLNFVTGVWSKCNATCNTRGQRSRKVTCSHVTWKYAKVLPEDKCLEAGLVKPETVRTCSYTGRCAVWRPGPWTTCRPQCGRVSYKTRYLVCEWSDTRELAWNTCDRRLKPETSKPCKPKPCSKVCRDKSRSCKRARFLRMCRYSSFRQQCCQSCQAKEQTTEISWRKSNSF
ncbi:A disintegrin and metalloproteinase with thrombospondin motifs 3 [Plakobranchus ocellatus]|uniref:A disintegrin and metalloproteinase with thrombospondin motifs 3 n=1 Tax=Plakobranchus ocellatus TaxID=259542 RepID=A0AAV4D1A0_9GAST|nr:A disintegrin and metalloproteinase with thrombospondin motifs 3 [Plakobranchus ocellatus]